MTSGIIANPTICIQCVYTCICSYSPTFLLTMITASTITSNAMVHVSTMKMLTQTMTTGRVLAVILISVGDWVAAQFCKQQRITQYFNNNELYLCLVPFSITVQRVVCEPRRKVWTEDGSVSIKNSIRYMYGQTYKTGTIALLHQDKNDIYCRSYTVLRCRFYCFDTAKLFSGYIRKTD